VLTTEGAATRATSLDSSGIESVTRLHRELVQLVRQLSAVSQQLADANADSRGLAGDDIRRAIQGASARVSAFVLELDDLVEARPSFGNGRANHPVPIRDWVRSAERFVADHYHEPLTLGQIAHAVQCSRDHLAKIFHRHTGTTIHRYLTEIRIAHAATLIRRGDKIDAVALLVGYRCRKNFYRHFKRILGSTPGAYRTQSVGAEGEQSECTHRGESR
jgi:AraC-like DNA-binding protein